MVDHFTTAEYPHVAFSPELAKETRDCRRKMLIMVTLERQLALCCKEIRRRGRDAAYKIPTPNMSATPAFFFQ